MFRGSKLEVKSDKNRSTNGVHLGIVFLWILVDCWRQVGRENGTKIDPKRHRKREGKVDSIKMAKKSQQDVQVPRGTWGPGP